MLGLADEIDAAMAEAVKGLRAYGYSWAEIGSRLGITRQAAQQRLGDRLTGSCKALNRTWRDTVRQRLCRQPTET